MPGCWAFTHHNEGMSSAQRLSLTGFVTLLLIALMMGANHVAARLAFNHGVNVVTAVSARSGMTALVVLLILWHQRVSWRITARHKRFLPLIGGLIAVQSVCLYSSGAPAGRTGAAGVQHLPHHHRPVCTCALRSPARTLCGDGHARHAAGSGTRT